jgi:PAS domain-containing protein
MLARYLNFVDTAAAAAFLWSTRREIVRANSAAREWTEDFVQLELLLTAAAECAAERRAELHVASGTTFLMIPLLDASNRTEYVVGVQGGDLRDVPLLLHELHENLRYFSQTIHLLPQAVLTARPNGSFDYASRRWFHITGTSVGETSVDASLRLATGKHEPFFERNWAKGIASGELFQFEIPLQTVRGVRWFELRAAPSYDGAHLRKWVVTLDDVHERVEARNEVARVRARLAALADIGAIALNRELRDEEFIERALALAHDALDAIWCVAFYINSHRIVRTYPEISVIPPGWPDNFGELSGIVTTSEQWFGETPRPVLRAPLEYGEDGNHYLAVAGRPGHDAFDDFDVDFVRDVAWRIGTALKNATRLRRESRIARVLQTAMLPVALPRPPGVSFDVAYATAETEALIGGDWYDAFELRDGRVAFSIGDVAGHGLNAAVIMGHVREIVRTLALRGASPGDVLNEANGDVCAGGYGLITAIVAYLDPQTLVVEYGCAGHAPPLRVDRDGTVEALEIGDVILGAAPRGRYRTQSLRLRRDTALVLYTDGLVEFTRDATAGENKLRDVLSQWASGGFTESANRLVELVLDGARASDDIAMLLVRAQPAVHNTYVSERRTPAKSAADSRS